VEGFETVSYRRVRAVDQPPDRVAGRLDLICVGRLLALLRDLAELHQRGGDALVGDERLPERVDVDPALLEACLGGDPGRVILVDTSPSDATQGTSGRFNTARHCEWGMAQIVDYELFKLPPRWLFLRIETSDGTVGWGEPVLEGRAETVKTAVEELMDGYLLGEESSRIEDHWQRMYRGGFYRGGPVLMSAIAGIDQALWDIKGKYSGEPVYDLLGGHSRDRIPLYKKIVPDETDEIAELATAAVDEGFTALKLLNAHQTSPIESTADIDAICEFLAVARDAVGRQVNIGLDLHGHVSAGMAPRVLSRLEEYDPMFVEEPVRPEHVQKLDRASNHNIPIAFGERLYSRWEFRPHLEAGRLDIAQPDITHAGGISEIKHIASMAETYGTQLMINCSVGPIAYAATSQLSHHLPNAVQQPAQGERYIDTYVENVDHLESEQGHVSLSDKPGLGLEIDEAGVREQAGKGSDWRTPVRRYNDGSFVEW
jgi:galactonate dehydratase